MSLINIPSLSRSLTGDFCIVRVRWVSRGGGRTTVMEFLTKGAESDVVK